MKKLFAFVGVVLLLTVICASAAPPFDRKITWSNPTTYTDGTPLVLGAGDNIIVHAFYCTSATDNALCSEIGVAAQNAVTGTWTSPQGVGTTAWYRARAESLKYGTLSPYDPGTSFFLKAPTPGALPPGKTVE